MPRTKQSLRRRAKSHRKQVMKLRLRKNRLKGQRKRSRSRPHRRQGPAKAQKRM
jgi:hypothetical protein